MERNKDKERRLQKENETVRQEGRDSQIERKTERDRETLRQRERDSDRQIERE